MYFYGFVVTLLISIFVARISNSAEPIDNMNIESTSSKPVIKLKLDYASSIQENNHIKKNASDIANTQSQIDSRRTYYSNSNLSDVSLSLEFSQNNVNKKNSMMVDEHMRVYEFRQPPNEKNFKNNHGNNFIISDIKIPKLKFSISLPSTNPSS